MKKKEQDEQTELLVLEETKQRNENQLVSLERCDNLAFIKQGQPAVKNEHSENHSSLSHSHRSSENCSTLKIYVHQI